MPPEHLEPLDHETRCAEYEAQRGARQLLQRRYPHELSLDEVEIVGDWAEVGARLIGRVQRDRVFVRHGLRYDGKRRNTG